MMPPHKWSLTSDTEARESALEKISPLRLPLPAKPSQTTAREVVAAPAGAAFPAKDRAAVPRHSPIRRPVAEHRATFFACRRIRSGPKGLSRSGARDSVSNRHSWMHSRLLQPFSQQTHRAKHAGLCRCCRNAQRFGNFRVRFVFDQPKLG